MWSEIIYLKILTTFLCILLEKGHGALQHASVQSRQPEPPPLSFPSFFSFRINISDWTKLFLWSSAKKVRKKSGLKWHTNWWPIRSILTPLIKTFGEKTTCMGRTFSSLSLSDRGLGDRFSSTALFPSLSLLEKHSPAWLTEAKSLNLGGWGSSAALPRNPYHILPPRGAVSLLILPSQWKQWLDMFVSQSLSMKHSG